MVDAMKRSPRFCLVVTGLCLCGMMFGCIARNNTSTNPTDPLTDNVTMSDLSDRSSNGSSMRVVELAFDVIHAEFPVDSIRHSQKVWNHVDELRVDAGVAARLARNGLRIGAASTTNWPAIEAVFKACNVQQHQVQLFAQHGLPLSIELGPVEDHESIFSYGMDNRLMGKTFSVGNKLINLDYAYHAELDGVTDVRLSLEVRHDRGIMTWERRDGVIRQVPSYDRFVYEDLCVELTLRPGEFLVIGPGSESQNEYLIGSRFLQGQRDTRKIETVLCIKPRIYQTGR